MLILASIMISLLIVLFLRFVNKKYVSPIFGVYQRPNKYYYFKFVFMYVFLRVRQLYIHVKDLLAVELGYSTYDGVHHIRDQDVALEQPYKLGDEPLAVDGVYFNGMSKTGAALICGIARRQDKACDAFLYLKVDGEDLMLSPQLPDTRLTQTGEESEYNVQGISAVNFIPMRTWKVSYNGELKSKSNTEKKVKVEMDLTWSANCPAFNFDSNMSPLGMAKDMARENWSLDYFRLLKKFHQTHYEQVGFIEGRVFVNGKAHELSMPCVRDHTFGKIREWRNFHRYVLHYIFLDNGDCIAVGCVSQPVILSHLTIGYYFRKSDQAILPVKSSDFQLWQHGENQTLPKDYGFVFKAGCESYQTQIQVTDETFFYIGKSRESKFNERWCDVDVNGIKGWACSEWQYNNVAGTYAQ